MANVYGDSGNRWWVGLNVGSDQSTILGTGSVLSPNGYESLPSGNAADDKQFAIAAGIDKGAAKPGTVNVEHVLWYNINGPFPSQNAANAAIPAIQKAHAAAGEWQQLTNAAVAQNGQAGANANPVTSPLTAIADFLTRLEQSGTWVRVAKVAIGGVLVVVGFLHMTGTDKVVTAAAKDALL